MEEVNIKTAFDQYYEYLQSSIWAQKRNDALIRDGFHCSICKNPNNLEVHHLRYPLLLGTEPISDLMTVCEGCHKKIESYKKGHEFYRGSWHLPSISYSVTSISLQVKWTEEISDKFYGRLQQIVRPRSERDGRNVFEVKFDRGKGTRAYFDSLSLEEMKKLESVFIKEFAEYIMPDSIEHCSTSKQVDFKNYI